MKKEKQYIYIAQLSNDSTKCKIGKSGDLGDRLKTYNKPITGVPINVLGTFKYLFVCEVQDMKQVENDIKDEFIKMRERKDREIYFFNEDWFGDYVKFIKEHPLFIEEIPIKVDENNKKIVEIKYSKKTSPPLKDRGITPKDVMQKAKRVADDEFYTRYEDVEKEISMYDKNIWEDKVVFCNCDDAVDEKDDRNTSAFALFFIRNFKELGLKKLICTHYSSKVDLFDAGSKGYAYFYIMTKDGFKG